MSSATDPTAPGAELIRIADLPEGGVTVVETEHGKLAVGIVDGRPFAVSNRCRHLRASLGKGKIADGCLECPWHGARYDTSTGEMTRGPQGVAFAAARGAVKAYASKLQPLRTYDVVERDGAIYLAS